MNAQTIYQEHLDAVSRAVMADDFATYMSLIDLPYLMRMADADYVLTTADEMEPTFRTLARGLARRGVTHYERVCREAQFQRPDRIVGRHFTHMIANGERVVAPHGASAALVRREGNLWRFTEASYPMISGDWPLSEATIFGDTGLPLANAGQPVHGRPA